MQDPTVRAFRKRLKFHGYAEINILQKKDDRGRVVTGVFVVSATEPLGKTRVVVDLFSCPDAASFQIIGYLPASIPVRVGIPTSKYPFSSCQRK